MFLCVASLSHNKIPDIDIWYNGIHKQNEDKFSLLTHIWKLSSPFLQLWNWFEMMDWYYFTSYSLHIGAILLTTKHAVLRGAVSYFLCKMMNSVATCIQLKLVFILYVWRQCLVSLKNISKDICFILEVSHSLVLITEISWWNLVWLDYINC